MRTFSGDIWCAVGFMGRYSCLNYDTWWVAIVQRSNTVLEMANGTAITAMQTWLEYVRRNWTAARGTACQFESSTPSALWSFMIAVGVLALLVVVVEDNT